MTSSVAVKQGATFSLPILVMLPAGTWSATCEVRKADGTLVGALAVTLADLPQPDADGNTHAGLLEATSAQTHEWQLGTWHADIRLSNTSTPPVVIYTETFAVTVHRSLSLA